MYETLPTYATSLKNENKYNVFTHKSKHRYATSKKEQRSNIYIIYGPGCYSPAIVKNQ